MVAYESNIRKAVSFADVLIGAVHVPGARAPVVVTRDMVASMKPRSVIMDIAIDQGGCVETSRPTTHHNPTFVAEGVIHYCVPNMASVVARSASQMLGHAALPFARAVANAVSTARSPATRTEARRGDAPGACGQREIGLPPGPAGGDVVSWMDVYRERVTSAEAAVSRVQSGQRVFMTGNCAVPQVLMDALVARAPGLRDVEICNILTFGKAPAADPAMAGTSASTRCSSATSTGAPSTRAGQTSPRATSRRCRACSREASCRWTPPSCT